MDFILPPLVGLTLLFFVVWGVRSLYHARIARMKGEYSSMGQTDASERDPNRNPKLKSSGMAR